MFSTVVMEVVTCARNRDMKKIENRLENIFMYNFNRRQYKNGGCLPIAKMKSVRKCLKPARPLYGDSCGCKKGLLVL